MPATRVSSGVANAATGTETVIVNTTTLSSQFVQLAIDLDYLATGETFEVKIFNSVPGVGSSNLIYTKVYSYPPDSGGHPLSPPVLITGSCLIALKQLTGTARAVAWHVHSWSGPTQIATGTTSAAVGNRTTLIDSSAYTNRWWVLTVDTTPLAAAEAVEIRGVTAIPSARYFEPQIRETFTSPLPDGPIIQTYPALAYDRIEFTVAQNNGTARALTWVVHNF